MKRAGVWVCLFAVAIMVAGNVQAQINTVEFIVHVLDPSRAAIVGATVTVKNNATGATRTAASSGTGEALFVGLPPGRYQVTVEAQGFNRLENPEIVLTIGQSAEWHALMQVGSGPATTIQVTEATELIETRRTGVAETVDSRRITNLPINGRNYINFTLTTSLAQRDNAPSIGAAPTSGINFGGQRARSNQVSVDGADATDNSINGVRSTVSQEAVQEFQLIVSNYMPEFGRATGGVINIVTKSGSNTFHGNVFGFFRHKDIQARNPFSVEIDPATNQPVAVKQGYTRFQGGITLGGPIKEDRTFYFLAYETTRRQESGFTDIGRNNFDLIPATFPGLPPGLLLTQTQIAYVAGQLGSANPINQATGAAYALFAGAAASLALNRSISNTLIGAIGQPPGLCTAQNAVFPLPVGGIPQCVPNSYKGLNGLRGNYPLHEGTSLWSGRLDHRWNDSNTSFVRVNVTPSTADGIQVNAQNQNFGQNAASRTSLQQFRDFALVGQHMTLFGSSVVNEARFQFARRGLHYGFANHPGGSDVAVNITGYAFFGREPFSTVDRIERRWQIADNVNWTWGKHNIKFGGDINIIQLRSKTDQIFELNFGGLFNFGALGSGAILSPVVSSIVGVPVIVTGSPDFTPVQAYGFGLPTVFIQGIGDSKQPFSNKAFAGFIQDSWRVHPRLTLNFGVRYDVELTPVFDPSTPINAAAQSALGVVNGIPRDKNNWSPRFALAWDPWGDGNTIIRMGYGIFFDHPLLAIAFNSVTADGARSVQLLSGGGSPSRAAITPLNASTAMNGASIFQGTLNAPSNFGFLSQEQRFNATLQNSIFVNQNFLASGIALPLLPFTLSVDDGFRYGYAQQANFTLERKLGNDYKVSFAYNYTHGAKLNRPRNITPPDSGRLVRNWRNALAINWGSVGATPPSSPITVGAPTGVIAGSATLCGFTPIVPGVLGTLSGCPAVGPNAGLNGQFLGTPAIFNFFRPQGPNPSFAALFPGGYGTPTTVGSQVFFAALAGYPTGFAGVRVPFSDVNQQESSGNSVYHGLTVAFSKRFTKNFEFLSSWTWSHAIDDSTDLQTLLNPQLNSRPDLERSNSTFDQRHRWVTSAVMQTPWRHTDDGAWKKIFADFTIAPIIEYAAGRPFNVLTGTDFNLDFGSNTDRPSVAPTGGVSSLFIPSTTFIPPTNCPRDPITGNPTNTIFAGLAGVPSFVGCSGNLGRNKFTRPTFFSLDLRISRKFYFTERLNLEFITDMFNLTNKFNVGDVSPLCNPTTACRAGEPTAALDPRQFQFALKFNW
jgi:hypothetical protein